MKKKVLILGSHSFSGSTMVNYLLDKKFDVYGTYNTRKSEKNLVFLKNRNLKKFKNYKINFLKKKDINKLSTLILKIKPAYIIDFASICDVQNSWHNPKDYININITSKLTLLNEISNLSYIKKYIYISTPEVFGSCDYYIDEKKNSFNPNTPYATSKLAAENLIKNYTNYKKLPGIITRFSNFYGPGQLDNRLIPKLLLSIKKKKKFPLHGNGLTVRSFIFSDDFCRGIYLSMKKGSIGDIYHFSNGKLFKIIDIVKNIYSYFNLNFKKNILIKKDRLGKDYAYKLKCEKTKKKLKWAPKVSLKHGIIKIIEYEKLFN